MAVGDELDDGGGFGVEELVVEGAVRDIVHFSGRFEAEVVGSGPKLFEMGRLGYGEVVEDASAKVV